MELMDKLLSDKGPITDDEMRVGETLIPSLQALATGSDGLWQLFVDRPDVKSWKYKRANSSVWTFYVEAQMPCDATMLYKTQADLAFRPEWDAYCLECRILADAVAATSNETVYWLVKFPWPLANRDYVYYRRASCADDGTWLLLSRSAALGAHVPVRDGGAVVRVDDYFFAGEFIPSAPNQCTVKLVFSDNPKGSIPSALVNWAATSAVPAFTSNLLSACQKYEKRQAEQAKHSGSDAPPTANSH
jgi:hypothetical protein